MFLQGLFFCTSLDNMDMCICTLLYIMYMPRFACRHSSTSNQDNHDVTDKEDEYSPVFSPEPVTTPTMVTPTQGSPSSAKKTRLREVSFSDISSSESDCEVIRGRKKSLEDDPVAFSEEMKMNKQLKSLVIVSENHW